MIGSYMSGVDGLYVVVVVVVVVVVHLGDG